MTNFVVVHADALAFLAATTAILNGSEKLQIDIGYIDHATIDNPTINTIQITAMPNTWMTLIFHYIVFGLLPVDIAEARSIKEKSRMYRVRGPIPGTRTTGVRFMLALTDYFTKWVEAVALGKGRK